MIDIHNLHDRAKRFVVGVVVKRLFEQKETTGSARPLVFLVLDELNKYAPREGWSPIKEVLLDIAERGRSLGVILIGAEQTASEVERRIVANSAIRVVGRLDPAEALRPEYGFLSATARQRAAILRPGSMILQQPHLPVPLEVRFPFPSWATRQSEAAEPPGPGDPVRPVRAMKILHTADWHVGKSLARRQRLDEAGAALKEVVAIAGDEKVDAVLVCGDIYEHLAPSPEAEAIVYETLLAWSGNEFRWS